MVAPTTPARGPSRLVRIRSSCVASADARWYTLSRIPASSGSDASAISPPTTIAVGATTLTTAASAAPSTRPASRTWCMATASPDFTSSTTSAVDPTSMPASPSWRITAVAVASTATQPRLPHVHMTSDCRIARMWPMSPARPWLPRSSSPSAMMPAPIPVATFTNTMWAAPGSAGGARRAPSR